MKFKKLIKKNKRWLIISSVIILVVIALIIIPKLGKKETANSSSSEGGQVQIVPLSSEEINILGQNVLSSPMIQDLPSKAVIGLQFYKFENGQRVWQSGFLIGKNGFMKSGTPDFVLIMHSKYISELNNKNLCNVVQDADSKGDIRIETKLSKTKLFLKYASMMKYRDCFGF